jgi:hypothetical protein
MKTPNIGIRTNSLGNRFQVRMRKNRIGFAKTFSSLEEAKNFLNKYYYVFMEDPEAFALKNKKKWY